MKLATDEFIRRFLLHVLPRGFHRIRHYGLLASAGCKANVERARALLAVAPVAAPAEPVEQPDPRPPCPCYNLLRVGHPRGRVSSLCLACRCACHAIPRLARAAPYWLPAGGKASPPGAPPPPSRPGGAAETGSSPGAAWRWLLRPAQSEPILAAHDRRRGCRLSCPLSGNRPDRLNDRHGAQTRRTGRKHPKCGFHPVQRFTCRPGSWRPHAVTTMTVRTPDKCA